MAYDDSKIPFRRVNFNSETGKLDGTAATVKESTRKFIHGPIPFNWLKKSNSLKGKTGAVGMALWFLHGVKKSDTFKITNQIEELAGCSRQVLGRALKSLQTADLIKFVQKPGARAVVTILKLD